MRDDVFDVGKDHLAAPATVPALFGMNFQAVSVAQKSETGGYLDAGGTPTAELTEALEHTDQSIGRLVGALIEQDLARGTVIIVAASHGQSPIDPARRRLIATTAIPALVNRIRPGLLAAVTQDDVALLWLTDGAMAGAVAAQLEAHASALGIDKVIGGAELRRALADPAQDARAPDLVVQTVPGVIYSDRQRKMAEHGGFSEDDRHVPLLVVVPGAAAGFIEEAVETRQVAPTIMAVLGLEPEQLKAVRQEPTEPLPGLSLGPAASLCPSGGLAAAQPVR